MKYSMSTKQKIIDASIDLFSTRNYKSCTIRDIAGAIDIKSASLYYHFKNKDEILFEILECFKYNFNKYRTPVNIILEAADKKPVRELLKMFFYTFGTDEEYAKMMKVAKIVIDLKLEFEEAADVFNRAFLDEPKEYLHYAFSQLIKEDKIRPFNYEALAYQMNAFSYFLFVEAIMRKLSRKESDRRFKEGIELLARGFEYAELMGS